MKNSMVYLIIFLILSLAFLILPLNIKESRANNTNYSLDSINKIDNTSEEKKEEEKKPNANSKSEDSSKSNEKKYIALTFDDGPSKFTLKIVELLKQYNYNATFFVLGSKLNIDDKQTLKVSINNGNEIGIHGYSHKSFTNLKENSLKEEIEKSKKYVYNLTDYMPKLVRPPYGNINNNIRKMALGPYILWNNDTLDWKLRDAKKIYNRLINSLEENNIILMHDTYLTTYKALELILPYLKENNYEVVTISKLFALNNKNLENNKSYRYAS